MASEHGQVSSRKGRPNYPVEFKRQLAMAACEPGVSVARIALEHRINTNLLFRWRREFQAGVFGNPEVTEGTLLPVTIISEKTREVTPAPVRERRPAKADAEESGTCIEVEVAGVVIRLWGRIDVQQLRAVLLSVRKSA